MSSKDLCCIHGLAFLRDDSTFNGIKIGATFGSDVFGFRVFYGKVNNKPENMTIYLRNLLLRAVEFLQPHSEKAEILFLACTKSRTSPTYRHGCLSHGHKDHH